MKVFCFVEKKEDFEEAIRYFKKASKSAFFLTTSPTLSLFISQRGEEVLKPTDYFHSQDHFLASDIVLSVLDHIYEKVNKNTLLSHSLGQYAAFHSQFYLNYLLYHCLLLDKIFKELDFQEVLLFTKENNVLPFLKIHDAERPINALLELVAIKYEKKTQVIKRSSFIKKRLSFIEKKSLKLLEIIQRVTISLIQKREKLFVTAANLKNFNNLLAKVPYQKLLIHSGDSSFEGEVDLILLRIGKSIFEALQSILSLGYKKNNKISLLPITLSCSKDENFSVESIINTEEVKHLLRVLDLDISSIYLEKFKFAFVPALINLLQVNNFLDKRLSTLKNPLMISPYSVGISSVLGEISNKHGFSNLLMGHGMIPAPQNKSMEKEIYYIGRNHLFNVYKNLIIQSQLELDFLEYFKIKRNLWKSGPLIWGVPDSQLEMLGDIRERWNIPESAQIILHASTQKPNSAFRINSYETPFEYIENIKVILNSIKEDENLYLVVKFRPDRNLSEEVLKNLLPLSDRLVIETSCTFFEALIASDLLISFSSTTIVEAINNNKPILIYGGDGRRSFAPAARFDIRGLDGVVFIDNRDDMLTGIHSILSRAIQESEKSSYLLATKEVVSFSSILKSILN